MISVDGETLSWLFEELQLDEVMVFVAKLVTFLVVCGICSVAIVAVGLLPSSDGQPNHEWLARMASVHFSAR